VETGIVSDKAYVRRLGDKGGPELARARDCFVRGDTVAAVNILEKVLERFPQNAIAWFVLGICFESINEPQRALELFTKSVSIKPNNAECWYNKGVTEAWLGRFDEAKASYERAIRIDPNVSGAWTNLGNVLMAKGDHDGAIKAYDRAASINTKRAEALHNRSFVHLLRGNWDQGWEEYEHRWRLPGAFYANPQPPHIPKWEGEPLDGKTILLLHEQGSGDTLMMLRYVPGLQFMGAKVILRVPGPLMRLVGLNFPGCVVEEYIHPNTERPQPEWPVCDYFLPMMSLPLRFGTMPDTVPFRDAPYLVAPTERAA
jgi:tetratricopeptide (TPR) repeat protein